MTERRVPVQPVLVKAECDCGEIMVREQGPGNTYLWPATYVCPKCGNREGSVTIDYPYIDWEEQDND